MKNILAAIMLMSSTVSVDAMIVQHVETVTHQCITRNAQEIAKLSWWQKKRRFHKYQELESKMIEDVTAFCDLFTQHNTDRAQIKAHTTALTNSYFDCIDHLTAWLTSSNDNPSLADEFHAVFGWESKLSQVIPALQNNAEQIFLTALSLRTSLPYVEHIINDVEDAKTNRLIHKAQRLLAEYTPAVEARIEQSNRMRKEATQQYQQTSAELQQITDLLADLTASDDAIDVLAGLTASDDAMCANTAKRSSRHTHIKHINERYDSLLFTGNEEEAQALQQILKELAASSTETPSFGDVGTPSNK